MSQTLLFLLFMIGELAAILLLYQFVIIPRVAEKTNSLFEERMLNKTWDIPAMLEDYTIHLAEVFSEIIKKLVPEVLGGHMSQGIQALKKDPDNLALVAASEWLQDQPLPIQMVANKLMPRLQDALDQASDKPKEASVKYNPGLDRR